MQTVSESSIELEGASSLEIALDRATERYRLGVLEGRSMKRARANDVISTALVASRDTDSSALPARLQWRGIEVTPEFQAYAARVARGEELAPYRGAVLARSTPEFPWASFQRPPERTERLEPPPFAARSLRHAAWLFGMAGAMLAAIGIGAGAFNPTDDGGPRAIDSATGALKPTHEESSIEVAASDPSASLDDDAATWRAAPGAPRESAVRERRAASGAPRRAPVAASSGDAMKAASEADGVAAEDPTASSAASGTTASAAASGGAAAPAAGAVQSPGGRRSSPSEGIRTAALGDGVSATTGGSALFSDQPSF
jgi:hypothetical protein